MRVSTLRLSTAVESSYGATGPRRGVNHVASPVLRVVASERFTARSGAGEWGLPHEKV
jgi:hypothetical protein